MSESQQIVALSRRSLARGEQLCLATVVHVEGSAYRKPGARMLVTSGGQRAGTISGGCLESEVSRKAWWLSAAGACVERYSSFADEDGGMPYGLGCGGTVTLLLEQGEPAQAVLSALDRVLSTRQPAVVVTALGDAFAVESPMTAGRPDADTFSGRFPAGTLAIFALPSTGAEAAGHQDEVLHPPAPELQYLRPDANPRGRQLLDPRLMHAAASVFQQRRSSLLTHSFDPQGAQDAEPPAYFVEYLAAPPALTIFGAGDDAQPIAALAHVLGWRVTIADGRAHLALPERFPQAAEVRVLDYADPALRAACGMPREPYSPAAGPSSLPSNGRQQPDPALLSDPIAIILTHSYEQDRALLTALLPRNLVYLGLLGPRHRTERLLLEVAPRLGLSPAACLARLHSPIGLDIGADDPAAVALSILAEIQAVLHSRQVVVTRSPTLAPGLSPDMIQDEEAAPLEKAGQPLANGSLHPATASEPRA